MDENLQQLIQELRNEKCPPRVSEDLARRLARQPAVQRKLWMAWAVGLVCMAALLAALKISDQPDRDAARPSPPLTLIRVEQARAAEEAGAALGYIGSVLLEAGKHTQNILLKEAVPPLRSGFESVGKTIKNQI